MPEMDGFKLIAEVRRLAPRLKAIAVTGYGREADVRRALQAGFDAHLSKPVSIELIKTAIRRLDSSAH